MLSSGIPALDERLGGLVEGRTYVLSGAPGTGKSVAAMEFIAAGVENGERAAILTHDDPGDLLTQAEFLGIDLMNSLQDEKVVLLRYQLDFPRRLMRAATPDLAFSELDRLVGEHRPARFVIDSITPFIEGSSASGGGLETLGTYLDRLGATTLITYSGDLGGVHDRRLEPLLQRAAAILHFVVRGDRTTAIEIQKVRYQVPSTAPISFRVQAGAGIVAVGADRRRYGDQPADSRRHVLVLNLSQSFPDELLAVLRASYDVAVRNSVTSAFADLAGPHPGLVLIDVRRDTLDQALALARQLRQAESRAPVILVTAFQLRSSDRARALRAGADDFIAADTHPEEVMHHLDAAIRRGHTPVEHDVPEREVPLVVQPAADNGRARPFDENAFIDAIRQHIEKDRVPFFTLVTMRPRGGSPEKLADVALRSMRVEGGDLSGIVDDEVFIYLHSVRRKDVTPFVERVRDEWRRAGEGELDVDIASYPKDEDRIRSLVATAAAPGA